MGDLIERQAAIKVAEGFGLNNGSALGRHSGVADMIAEAIGSLPAIDAKSVLPEQMRVEITTDDFTCVERAKEKGFYRKHYFCPSCGIEIGHKTFDEKRQFGQGTVLHSNKFPNYCPDCGAKLEMKN